MPSDDSVTTAAGPSAARAARSSKLTRPDLLEMYRIMALSRTLDERIWLLNRQGKAAIAASAQGHEAAQVACLFATDPSRDHYLIYYRELTTLLAVGLTPLDLLKGFLAKEGEPMSGGRQFPTHGALTGVDMFSFSNVVGSQLPQAAGVALADRMRGEPRVTIVYFGDGAASQGDTHEAMNFAGIHRLPIIFFCENNRYAISVPLSKQMAIENIAARAAGYGFPGVTLDGTDPIGVYEAVYAAAERARKGGGPTLIEVMVERLFPHTTDDDHTRYRPPEDIRQMRSRDPLPKFEAQLRKAGILDDATHDRIWSEAKRIVNDATEEAEAAPYPQTDQFARHLFAEP
ncbi:MAG: thiamine pyrophosphate-dependent dehydrogenase E1 component subunit alpha [Chloroflexi bacterium]|nr:thiamine pyrophosphate-dependent dehydrogenase E1 component subunit alpha [Chloroflexota bacterium]